MPTYDWTIPTVEYTLKPDLTPDKATVIHWRCVATENGMVDSLYGSVSVTGDMDAATLTEADAIAYVQQARNPDVEAQLLERLGARAVPTAATGLPWEAQFPEWAVGVSYAIDDYVNYRGVAYKVIQAHVSQGDWPPPVVPALFQADQDPGQSDPVWLAGEAVGVGDLRWYPDINGTQYSAIQAHTTQVGWEPPNVPALWASV